MFGTFKQQGTTAQNVGYTSYSMLLTQTSANAPIKTDLSGNSLPANNVLSKTPMEIRVYP